MLDFQLVIGPVTLGDAQRFIARQHGHCDAPHGWRYGALDRTSVAARGKPQANNCE